MFKIVEFKDGVHVIPKNWIINDNNEVKCRFPVMIIKENEFNETVKNAINP